MKEAKVRPVLNAARRLRHLKMRAVKATAWLEAAEAPHADLLQEIAEIQERWEPIFRSARAAFFADNARQIIADFPADWRRHRRLTDQWEAILSRPENKMERLRALLARAEERAFDAAEEYTRALSDAFLSPPGMRVATKDTQDTFTHIGLWTRSAAHVCSTRLGRKFEQYESLCGQQIDWSYSTPEHVECDICLRLLDEATLQTRAARAARVEEGK